MLQQYSYLLALEKEESLYNHDMICPIKSAAVLLCLINSQKIPTNTLHSVKNYDILNKPG